MTEQTKTKTVAKAKKPKVPQDHKTKMKTPKVSAVRTESGAVVTLRGITVTIVNEAFNDWELLEALGELDPENPKSVGVLPGLLKRALAPGDDMKVKKILRDPNTGRISIRDGVEFTLELFKAVNPNG